MDPLRIALACDWFLPRTGGLELHVRDLALRLRSAGHDARVLTSTPGPPEEDGIPVHRVEAPRAPRYGFIFTPSGLRRMEEILKGEGFQRVHAQISVVAPCGWGAAWLGPRLGIPTVATFHSVLGPVRPLLRLLDRAVGWSDWPVAWTAVSPVVGAEFLPLLGRTLPILPNAVDPAEWTPQGVALGAPRPPPEAPPGRNGVPPEHPVTFVSVMRLNFRKRPEALVRIAAAVVRELGGHPPVRFLVVGDGPFRSRTLRLVRRLGLEGVVEVTGFLPREGVRVALARSDIFLLPAIMESFGIAALQARAAGLPVVARREGGVGGFIRDGEEGFLVSSDAMMTDRLVRLARDPGLRRALSRGSGDPLPFTWEQVLPLYLEVYRGAPDPGRTAPSPHPNSVRR